VFIYTREAHPGENVPCHDGFGDKLACARLLQAMCLGITVDEVATGVLYIHPALTEVIEQTLLDL